MRKEQWVKDDDATLDYKFNWAPEGDRWLQEGETIVSYVLTVDPGLTLVSSSNTTTDITVWLSGGTIGTKYRIACRITTNNVPARVDERTRYLLVTER